MPGIPESPPPSGSSPLTIIRRYNVERSCIRCHQRKVRCNKANPCVTCVRAKVPCRYPGPERTKRRSQTNTLVKVGHRLDVRERPVTGISHAENPTVDQADIGPEFATLTPARLVAGKSSDADHSGGFLLKDGSSTRYINEFTFSRVLDKASSTFRRSMYNVLG